MAFIQTTSLRKIYRPGRDNPVKAVDGVDIEIEKGRRVAILGPSGSGKSTLLNLIGGLDRPTSGSVIVDGKDIGSFSEREMAAYRAGSVGFVFQSFHLRSRFPAWENVALPLVFAGIDRRRRRSRAFEMLDRVGLGHRASHLPGEMSGGEQQRVALARGLVQNPALVLGDEPTGNLDSETSRQILQLLSEINESGTTVVIVTHDTELAGTYAQRLIHMSDGKVRSEEEVPA